MITTKILINYNISTPGAIFMTVDVKNFYLNTPMYRFDYVLIKQMDVPPKNIDQYDLFTIAHGVQVYLEVLKGIY